VSSPFLYTIKVQCHGSNAKLSGPINLTFNSNSNKISTAIRHVRQHLCSSRRRKFRCNKFAYFDNLMRKKKLIFRDNTSYALIKHRAGRYVEPPHGHSMTDNNSPMNCCIARVCIVCIDDRLDPPLADKLFLDMFAQIVMIIRSLLTACCQCTIHQPQSESRLVWGSSFWRDSPLTTTRPRKHIFNKLCSQLAESQVLVLPML
jgi:hypothetical protein